MKNLKASLIMTLLVLGQGLNAKTYTSEEELFAPTAEEIKAREILKRANDRKTRCQAIAQAYREAVQKAKNEKDFTITQTTLPFDTLIDGYQQDVQHLTDCLSFFTKNYIENNRSKTLAGGVDFGYALTNPTIITVHVKQETFLESFNKNWFGYKDWFSAQ